MFTGIITGCGEIIGVDAKPGLVTFTIKLPHGSEQALHTGASVSVAGVCLTVTASERNIAVFDVMQETLRVTTLGSLRLGSKVNIERSAQGGAEIGGHIVSGHIDCMAKVVEINRPQNNTVVTFKVPARWMKYLFAKGFVALNGCSLTVTNPDRDACTFQVWFIPETLSRTTFGSIQIGDEVNLEVERTTQVIVDTVETQLSQMLGPLMPKIQALLVNDEKLGTR